MAKATTKATSATTAAPAGVTAEVTPLDQYLANLANDPTAVREAFAEVTSTERGGKGLEIAVAAANRLAFPTDILLSYDPGAKNAKAHPVATAIRKAMDEADPAISSTGRADMSAALGMAVNATEDGLARFARYDVNGVEGTGNADKPAFERVPKVNRTDNKSPADYQAEIQAIVDTTNSAERKALYQQALDAIGDTDRIRRLARSLGAAMVAAGKRQNMVYLPLIADQLAEYGEKMKGTEAKSPGTIWNEANAKAKAGHRAAYTPDGDVGERLKPSLEEVQQAIHDAVDVFLYGEPQEDGDRKGGQVATAEGKAKASEEEQLAGAIKQLYSAGRKIDALEGHGFADSITNKLHVMLRHILPDLHQDRLDAENAAKEKENAEKAAAAQAEAERLAQERINAKNAATARANGQTAATGADVNRAQANVAAAKSKGAAGGAAARVAPATGKAPTPSPTPTPAPTTSAAISDELAALEGKPASVPASKAPAGKRK